MPITMISTSGYDSEKVAKYTIVYKTIDPKYNSSSKFYLNIDNVDTIAPEFVGDMEYTNNYGTIFTTSDLTLSAIDNIDGVINQWSNTVQPGKVAITENYQSADPSIKFTGSGSDVPGDYILKVVAEDYSGNKSSALITIHQLAADPVYVGENTEIINVPLGFNNEYYPMREANESGMIMYNSRQVGAPRAANVAFNTIDGDPIPFISEYQSKPTTNTRNGVYFYEARTSVLSNGNYPADNEFTWCAGQIYGETKINTCQDVDVKVIES